MVIDAIYSLATILLMCGSKMFFQRGSNSDVVFVWAMMAQLWMLAWFYRGSGPVLLKKLYFYDFSGGGGPDPLSPSLDPPMWLRGKRLDCCSTLIVLWLSLLCSLCLWHFIVILTYFLCYRYLVYMFGSCKTQKDLSTRCGSVM